MLTTSNTLYLFERLASVLIAFFSNLILIKILEPQHYALYVLVLGLSAISVQITKLGIEDLVAHIMSKSQGLNQSLKRFYAFRLAATPILTIFLLLIFTQSKFALQIPLVITVATIAIFDAMNFGELNLIIQSNFKRVAFGGLARSIMGISSRVLILFLGISNINLMLIVVLFEVIIFRLVTTTKSQINILAESNDVLSIKAITLIFFLVTLLYSKFEFLICSKILSKHELESYLATSRFIELFAFIINIYGAIFMNQYLNSAPDSRLKFIKQTTIKFSFIYVAFSILFFGLFTQIIAEYILDEFYSVQKFLHFGFLSLLPLYIGFAYGRHLIFTNQLRLYILIIFVGLFVSLGSMVVISFLLNLTYKYIIVCSTLGNLTTSLLAIYFVNKNSQ